MADKLEVVVARGRVWIKRGHRSFMLGYDDEEPAAVENYARMLREVLGVPSKLRPPFDNPIAIEHIFFGAYFNWSQPGVGFGQLSFNQDDKTGLTCMNETMDREWIRHALYALADHVADNAKLEDE